jgi:hypothetical protein
MSKERCVVFYCGYWVVIIKRKRISRHKIKEEAVIARDKYLKEHPELKIRGLEKRDEV